MIVEQIVIYCHDLQSRSLLIPSPRRMLNFILYEADAYFCVPRARCLYIILYRWMLISYVCPGICLLCFLRRTLIFYAPPTDPYYTPQGERMSFASRTMSRNASLPRKRIAYPLHISLYIYMCALRC